MQLKEEYKNMVNNIAIFKFKNEEKKLELELDTPNFSNFVKEIITNNYEVSNENMDVFLKENGDNQIDITELKNIVIEIHHQYLDDISAFFENTKNEISTYYSDDTKIIEELQKYIEKVALDDSN